MPAGIPAHPSEKDDRISAVIPVMYVMYEGAYSSFSLAVKEAMSMTFSFVPSATASVISTV